LEAFVHQLNAYLQYLAKSQMTQWHQTVFAGSPICEKLLGVIAIANGKGAPYTVSEVMSLHNLGSPGTIHRRLESLRRGGLIEQIQKNEDRRTKYLVPTEMANRFFTNMDYVMEQAVLDSSVKSRLIHSKI
jgi:hypothetical protein